MQNQSQKQEARAQTESSWNNRGEKGGYFQHKGSNPTASARTTAQQQQRNCSKVAVFIPENKTMAGAQKAVQQQKRRIICTLHQTTRLHHHTPDWPSAKTLEAKAAVDILELRGVVAFLELLLGSVSS